MKRIRLISIVGVFALVLAACGTGEGGDTTTTEAETTTTAAGETTTTAGEETTTTADDMALPDLGGRTITVGVENAYIPFNYIPIGADEPEGWDYDAWEAICELLNCVPEFVESAWPAVIDQVAQGELDTAADGISITDERKEIVDFSDPYMTVTQKFIVQLDDDRYATAQDLIDDEDAIVATQVGTTNFELAVDLVGEDRIQAFDQFGLAIQALIAGDVDAVIIDDAAGLGYIGENSEQIKTIDDPLQSDPLGFIYPLGSDLVDPVNQAIAALAEDGTLEELGRKYFGPDFDIGYEDIEEVG
ncbi:MAG: ABC transporter substrate-binding protein [Actinobacteria bacterium]|nr:MAG: ABC transporter substrate-binding protein [Actinomycetota bacterium]REK40732.1 MAG: ABC transporter substrate-binding protein [Actinomycetota bacterium]